MITRVPKHPNYMDSVLLELSEEEGQLLGKYLALIDIQLKSRPTIQSDSEEEAISKLYTKFDKLYHEARWCQSKDCNKWKEYNLEQP